MKVKVVVRKSAILFMAFCISQFYISCGNNRGNKKEVAMVKPNIILILTDDLGYGDLGCFGQDSIETPHIDQLAHDGIVFTQHYAGSTVCAPSRCCLMTGLHTGHSAIRGNSNVALNKSDTTVATLLKTAGYTTGMIGKWGLGEYGTTGTPQESGFDYFFGYLNQIRAHNYYPDYLWQNSQKVPLENELKIADEGYSAGIGAASTNKKDYTHDLFTEEAIKFIEASKESPFFLYLAYTIPHANNEHWMTSEHGMEVPDYCIYNEQDWPDAQKGLAAMISRMDGDVGAIRDRLETLGIAKNTVILFTSDNGPHAEGGNNPDFFNSNGILRGYKRDLYEGGIRIPLIACWPETIKAGMSSEHISAFWDFLPTACELAGIDAPQNTDGISYLSELLGKEQKQHDHLYWEFHEQGAKQAVRIGDWKGVRLNMANNPSAPIELYNLSLDISEEHNMAKEHSEIVKKIDEIMISEHTYSDAFSLEFERRK